MILQRLTLQNFRQFKGIQKIDFAAETGSEGKNVTVIFGDNGRGKTGIFRAIMFCLYGDQTLSQDEDITAGELHMVNSAALQEAAAEGKKPVETSVELEFEHKGDHYFIRRNLLGMIDGDKRHEQPDTVMLTHRKVDGNTQVIYDPEKIKQTVTKILNKNIKDYFLFDGEKIQRLTLASIQQRKEVSKGIRNLLNIDALEKAIGATRRLKTQLNTELGKRATGEYRQVVLQLNDRNADHYSLQSDLEKLEDEYSHSENQKLLVKKELEQHKDILHLIRARDDKYNELQCEQEQATNLLAEMKTRTGKASLLLLSDTVNHVFSLLDSKHKKGEIPSQMRKDFIEKLLEQEQCICGRELLPNTEPYQQITFWKDSTSDVELDKAALDMWRDLNSIINQRDDISSTIETHLQRYGVLRTNIEKLRSKIEELSDEIGGPQRQDAAKLESHIKEIERKQVKNEAAQMRAKEQLSSIETQIEQLENRRKSLEREESIKNELSQRAELADAANKALQSVHDEFTKEIRQKIAREANLYFSELLDKEGRETLRNIVVNDDYSLQIYDKWKKPFLADISAGQRQIMSISFIAALAKVASMNSILEMPLFMDTPFGRLSSEHRKNLIVKIPSFCAQWILLATDTEFRKEEAKLLSDGARWGKFYWLNGAGAGISKIEERDVGDALAMLSTRLKELS